MTMTEKLKTLLVAEVIPDLEETIDEIFSIIEKAKMASLSDKEELQELQEMLVECKDIIVDIDTGEMEEEEAEDIFTELMALKTIEE